MCFLADMIIILDKQISTTRTKSGGHNKEVPEHVLTFFVEQDSGWTEIQRSWNEVQWTGNETSCNCHLFAILEKVYSVVTYGCPADHVTGFKNSGLRRLLSECRSRYV